MPCLREAPFADFGRSSNHKTKDLCHGLGYRESVKVSEVYFLLLIASH